MTTGNNERDERLSYGTQTLPSPDGYSVPCRCGTTLTWHVGNHGQNAADCPCGMSYYATDEATVKIEGYDRNAL
jgi:hypothetical protein